MSVTSFIEKIVGLQQQRAQAKVAGYRELIATIAAGQELNPAEVERLLADAGKSFDDLQRDVELCQRRLGFKAAVATMPKLEAERKSLDDHIAATDRVLEAAEKHHRELADRFDKEADAARRELEQLDQTRAEFAQRRE